MINLNWTDSISLMSDNRHIEGDPYGTTETP